MQQTIAFVGGGNMARALVGGLLNMGWPAAAIRLSEPLAAQREALAHSWPHLSLFADNLPALEGADIVVFAVKPQVLPDVVRQLAAKIRAAEPLVISIAAGIRVAAVHAWLGGHLPIVRCMPNMPALLGCGITGLYASAEVDIGKRERAQQIMRAVGDTVWLDREADIDIVTALSGSGPAYFFLLMEAMEDAAVQLGLDRTAARQLCLHTAHGAARLALEGNETPPQLRARVTSPGGTTERALRVFEEGGLRTMVATALAAAAERARHLSDEAEHKHG